MKALILFTLFLHINLIFFAQKGKDGIKTINTTTVVNEFTVLTSDANINETQISLSQTTLNDNNRFSNNLSAGDLILIIQVQGASVDASAEPWTGNGTYGLPYTPGWGAITNYNNCGNFEYAEIASVNSATVITLRCGLENNYTAIGKTQIVRVPRLESLVVNDTLTTDQWNGNVGGIIALEIDGDININSGGVISASGLGFRGGLSSLRNNILGAGEFASIEPTHGGMKGEGIAGYSNDYTIMGGQYGKGAAANAGGGSTSHNAGGGGGGNAGDILNWNDGVGNPNTAYNTAWSIETPSLANITSSGGGRGGYTYSDNNRNANTTPSNDLSWGADARQNDGGLGGRPLDYSLNKLFFGGGGGAGELNDSENKGANGGNSGGLILLKVFGDINGDGKIESNGQNGEDVYTDNAPLFSFGGNDSAGGGGAGGTIKIENKTGGTIGNLNIEANGGKGGNQDLKRGALFVQLINEAEGPGGGGGGGYISVPTNTSTLNIIGGVNGVTNSNALNEFPPNGATSGGNGIINNNTSDILDLVALNDTICYGSFTTLNVSLSNTIPTTSSILWYDKDFNIIHSGNSFTTNTITSDTTFYVGVCPGNTSVKVEVILGASFTADTSNLILTDEHCNQTDGSINGITLNGGAQPLTYEWNGSTSTTLSLNNLNAGNYELIVTDNNGCELKIGDFNIANETGPVIDSTNFNLQNENCDLSNGTISNITVSGGTTPYNYSWNGNSSTLELQNLSAGNYSLIISDINGCIDSTGIYTIINETGPNIDTSNIIVTPETCELENGEIENINVTNGTMPYNYLWSNNSNNLALDNLQNGTYQLIVSDLNNCKDSVLIQINEYGFPDAGFSLTTNNFATNEQIIFTNTSSNDVNSWEYNYGNGITDNVTSPNTSYSTPGDYTICLTVANQYGCEDNYCDAITIIDQNIIPNIFTPNNDGKNEVFFIQNLPNNASLEIYDRWGNNVYKSSPYLNDWDGKTNNGKKLSEGTYYYIIESNETYTGHFSLIR